MRLEFAWTESAAGGHEIFVEGPRKPRPGRGGAPYCDAMWRVVAVHLGMIDTEGISGQRTVVWAGQLLADENFRGALGL